MKQLKNDFITTPLKKFYYGSLVILAVSLLVSTLLISHTFVKKEQARANIMIGSISQALDTEYRYIVEEFFTTSYDSIFLRVKNTLKKFGNEQFKLFFYNAKGQCTYSKKSSDTNIKCVELNNSYSYEDSKIQHRINDNILELFTPLTLSTEKIGYLLIKIEDQDRFYNMSISSFMLTNYLPLFLVVLLFWLAWIFYSKRFILLPYFNKVFKFQNQKISTSVLSQIVHDTRGDIESLESIGTDLFQKSDSSGQSILSLVKNLKESLEQIEINPEQSTQNLSDSRLNEFIKDNKKRVLARYEKHQGLNINYTEQNILKYNLIVSIHENRLHRAIFNLIENSIESVPNDQQAEIEIDYSFKNNNLMISIKDNGIGIPLTINPFSKEYTTKPESSGGSGLHYARKVILDMNGEISFSSNDKGTVFIISLSSYKQRVIVLEDNLEKSNRYRRTLADLSLEHQVFNTPKDLIQEIEYLSTSDIFILDYDLNTDMNGLDVVKVIYNQGFKELYLRSGNITLVENNHPFIKKMLKRSSLVDAIREIGVNIP